MPPKMYVCDSHDCKHNNGEGDCIRETITINQYGTCDQWKPEEKQ